MERRLYYIIMVTLIITQLYEACRGSGAFGMSGWIFIALHLDFTEAHLNSSGNTRLLLPILTLQPCLVVLPCIFHWFRRQCAPFMLISELRHFAALLKTSF